MVAQTSCEKNPKKTQSNPFNDRMSKIPSNSTLFGWPNPNQSRTVPSVPIRAQVSHGWCSRCQDSPIHAHPCTCQRQGCARREGGRQAGKEGAGSPRAGTGLSQPLSRPPGGPRAALAAELAHLVPAQPLPHRLVQLRVPGAAGHQHVGVHVPGGSAVAHGRGEEEEDGEGAASSLRRRTAHRPGDEKRLRRPRGARGFPRGRVLSPAGAASGD